MMEEQFTYEEFLKKLPHREDHFHKGDCGRVFLIAGSRNMCGAAYLAGKAAYRAGAGLVYIYTEECNRVILQQLLPEAVLITYEEETWSPEELDAGMQDKDVIAIGPGFGTDGIKKEILKRVLMANEKKRILDADAINLLSYHKELWGYIKAPLILTPHMGEMQRLCGKSIDAIRQDMAGCASSFAKEHGVILVLKDHRTIVADGGEKYYRNSTGNHGMATGGSGDVLTGVISGLLSQKMELFEAAKTGVYAHGLAGDQVRKVRGTYSMMAGDLADAILFGIDNNSRGV